MFYTEVRVGSCAAEAKPLFTTGDPDVGRAALVALTQKASLNVAGTAFDRLVGELTTNGSRKRTRS